MRKISIQLSKGGVGKSTTAVNLAAGLAAEGKRVLLVDSDTQAQCSQMLGVKVDRGLVDLIEDTVKPTEVIVQARPDLWLLAGSMALGKIKKMIAQKDFKSEAVLSEALEAFEGYFDFVLLDTSPGWDSLTVNVLFYADEVLSPVSLEALSISGFMAFLEGLKPIQKYKKIPIAYVLPTFLDRRVRKSTDVLRQLEEHFADRLCDPIRYSARLSECPAWGKTIYEYSPRDRGAEDYRKLTRRILNGKE